MIYYNKVASEYGERFTEAAVWLPCPQQYCPLLLRQLFSIFRGLNETGAVEARQGTGSQLSELGYWRPDRVLSHGWVNWGNGGQRGYQFTAEWIRARAAKEGTSSHLTELGQRRPDRVLSHSWVNWGSGGQRKYWFTGEWTGVLEASHGRLNWGSGDKLPTKAFANVR